MAASLQDTAVTHTPSHVLAPLTALTPRTPPHITVQVWELQDAAAPISVGIAHSNEVTAAHFSPDGKQVVSVGKDCCICVWNFFG